MPKANSRCPLISPASAKGVARKAAPVPVRATSVKSSAHVGLSVRAATRAVSVKADAAAADVPVLLQVG